MSIKLRQLFEPEFNAVANTGKVPPVLYVVLLTLRRCLPVSTQDIEGANSRLQQLVTLAPHMKWARTSDKMQLRGGDPISVDELVAMHEQTLVAMASEAHMNRFLVAETPGHKTFFSMTALSPSLSLIVCSSCL